MSANPKTTKEPAPFNAADEEQVRKRKSEAEVREQRITAGLKHVLSHPDGRLWLFSLLEEAAPFQDPFTGNSETFYRCGKQSWARRLIARLLDNHLDEYVLMNREAKQL